MQVRIYALAIAAMTLGPVATASAQADDVVVDGRIITGENYRSAASAAPIDPQFTGGVFVGAGDGSGGGAKGKASNFQAYDTTFKGGVRVAEGDTIGGHNTGALRNVSGNSTSGGTRHSGGANFAFGDGSVRNLDQSVGANEVIATSGHRTEGPKLGSLGSLKGLGSIGQLAVPPDGQPATASNNLKQLGLGAHNYGDAADKGDDIADIVTGAGPGSGPHVKSIDPGRQAGASHVKVFDGARATGPGIKVFDGRTDAATAANKNVVKGLTVK